MNGEHGMDNLPRVLFGHGVNAGADILTVSLYLFQRILTEITEHLETLCRQLGNTAAIKHVWQILSDMG